MGHRISLMFTPKVNTTTGEHEVKATIDVAGAEGQECLDLTAPLEAALGLSDVEREETSDMLVPMSSERERQTW